MARPCPICGKGMFRRKQLIRHIRKQHPDHYHRFIKNGNFVMTSWCNGLRKNNLLLPPVCKQILHVIEK